MKTNYFILLLALLIWISCGKNEVPEVCNIVDINLSEGDSIAHVSPTKDYYWTGFEDDTYININYAYKVGNFNESEKFSFIIKKGNCLTIDYAYKFYDGKFYDVSALTIMEVLDFGYQTHISKKLITGFVSFKDPHSKEIITKKFWVNLKTKPTEEAPIYFKNCIGNQIPIAIDMNKDGITDFSFETEIIENKSNKPNFKRYKVYLKSNQASNGILSPIKNNPPYTVIFEAPFTSQNTQIYITDVKDELDIFYEFAAPFESYNFWVNNGLTYSELLTNSKEDYYLVSLRQGTFVYYGWIKFRFLVRNCQIQVLDTYLHPIANQHISVQ